MVRLVAICLLLAVPACGAHESEPADDLMLSERALPPFHGRFGSPTIIRDGDQLHAYFALQAFQGERVNVTHARSADNGQTWQRIGEAVPRLNELAVQDGSVWAPGAAKIADGHWMIYYTAVQAGTERHMCIFRAHAMSPVDGG